MKSYILLVFLFWGCAPRSQSATSPEPAQGERPFVLTVSEHRTDRRSSPAMGESPVVVSELVLTLYGRVDRSDVVAGDMVVFYADSISMESRRPFAFRTFMSADTVYYSAPGGRGAIDHTGDADLDTMLSCVFGGPALIAFVSPTGAPDSTFHSNERCPSGEYGRINAPVTLCAFLFGRSTLGAASRGEGGLRWRESRPVPSFSGIGFHPRIDLLFREVGKAGESATVTVAADSTIENCVTRMKNGEEVMILHDRFRVGGTLTVERSTGLTSAGEIRVREELKLVRSNAGGVVMEKEGEYTIRFLVRPASGRSN
jgi:hypothetical protein